MDTNLRSIKDFSNTESALKISTGRVGIGATGALTQSGVLTIKASGENLISFKNSANVEIAYIQDGGNFAAPGAYHTAAGFIATQLFKLDAGVRFVSSTDGILLLHNDASSSFDRIQFGGVTGLNPALKRNGTTLEVKLADNTDYTGLVAKEYTVDNGDFKILTSSKGLNFYGSGLFFLNSGLIHDYTNAGASEGAYHRFRSPSIATSGVQKVISIESNFGATAGGANFRPFNIEYTINNSGGQTGAASGIFLNATVTGGGLNGMSHDLLTLNTNNAEVFRVDSAGRVLTGNSITVQIGSSINWSNRTVISSPGDGDLRMTSNNGGSFNRLMFGPDSDVSPALKRNGDSLELITAGTTGSFTNLKGSTLTGSGYFSVVAEQRLQIGAVPNRVLLANGGDGNLTLLSPSETTFGMLQFGGVTGLHPALKRNGATLEVKLADDSAYTPLAAGQFSIGGWNTSLGTNSIFLNGALLYSVSGNVLSISSDGGNNNIKVRTTASSGNSEIINGTGSPETVITADVGSIFMRTDGGAGTTFYVKESGSGNTGWVPK
jgi:hypothetical protein